MKTQFITRQDYIKGKFFNIFESFLLLFRPAKIAAIKKYVLLQSFDADQTFSNHVGLYKDQNGKKVIIRQLAYHLPNMKYIQVYHEASILMMLNKIGKYKKNRSSISFPRLYTFSDTKKTLVLIREYVNGTVLSEYAPSKQYTVLQTILNEFEMLSKEIMKDKNIKLPKQSQLEMYFLLPFYVAKVFFAQPDELLLLIKLMKVFYSQFSLQNLLHVPYILAHRDLHARNILLAKEKIHILDMEVSLLAPELTDLAIISRYYAQTLRTKKLLQLITKKVLTENQKKIFLQLTIYYALQFLSLEDKKTIYYKNVFPYLRLITNHIYPALGERFSKQSLEADSSKIKHSKKNKYSLTVGIPAHNEQANIASILQMILKQKAETYRLGKILVICDGCTDRTDEIVTRLAEKYHVITCINDHQRMGKTARIKQMFAVNTSQIIVLLDADILPVQDDFLDQLIKKFDDRSIGLVAADVRPIKSEKFVGKMLYTWTLMWTEARQKVNNGDYVYNFRGPAFALRKSLAKKVDSPDSVISQSQYIYFFTKKKGMDTLFTKDATILFSLPETIADYISWTSRGDADEIKAFARIFGNRVYNEYKLPRKYKIAALFNMLRTNPVMTILSIIFIKYISLLPKKNSMIKPGVWEMVTSTKKKVSIEKIKTAL